MKVLIRLFSFKDWDHKQIAEFHQTIQRLQSETQDRRGLLNIVAAEHARSDQFTPGKQVALRQALISFGGDAIHPLSEQARLSNSPEVRISAVFALTKINHSDTIPVLLQYIENSNYWVALTCVKGLAERKDARSIEPFLTLLNGHRWRQLTGEKTKFHVVSVDIAVQIRFMAAESLAEMGESRVFAHLLEMTGDTGVAQHAVSGLEKLLIRNSASLSELELQQLIELKDLYQKPIESDYYRGYYTNKLEPVSCTNLERMARDELDRRRKAN
ncbi:MAG: HEAT repeat domain-containing protein [Chloroflexi bacterium]|nr:HEAT repeat domain-containing protein [Chloroflexota bacterium]